MWDADVFFERFVDGRRLRAVAVEVEFGNGKGKF